MSLFSILNTGTSGLSASQMQMDIASQNITNADVKGYSRKRISLSADYRQDAAFGQVGTGVDVNSIERMRSQFIDEQILRQNQEKGTYQEYDNTLGIIENAFTEPSDTGLQKALDTFFDGWYNLSNDPQSIPIRNVVRTDAENLAAKFHSLSNELQNVRVTRNDEIATRVTRVNELSEKISNLNTEIGSVEITRNQHANDSRDKRDELVKELSGLIDITTIENERGQVTITTGGSLLVSPLDFQKLETFSVSYTRPDGSQYNDTGIRFAETKRTFVPQKGQIRGLIDSRDIIVPQYQDKLDTLARTLVDKINALHQKGYSLNGISGNSFFNASVTGASDISLAPAITADVKNIAAAAGGASMPAAANTSAAGAHSFGGAPVQLVRDPAATVIVPAKNIVAGTVTVSNGSQLLSEGADYHIDYASGTLQMLHAGFNAAALTINFQFMTSGFNGPEDNGTAIAIAQLRSNPAMEPDVLGNPTASFVESYSSLVGQIGSDKNAAKSNLDTRDFLVQQYESSQDAIAGVSLDEEMSNLIKFQHTYQASAHLITVAQKMLDALMNM